MFQFSCSFAFLSIFCLNPLEFLDEIWHQKTRIVGLPDGDEIITLAFFVLTIPARHGRTDTQTDGQD